jgi:hypothetical protein
MYYSGGRRQVDDESEVHRAALFRTGACRRTGLLTQDTDEQTNERKVAQVEFHNSPFKCGNVLTNRIWRTALQ